MTVAHLQYLQEKDKLVAALLKPRLVAAEHAPGQLLFDLLILDKLRLTLAPRGGLQGGGAGGALRLGLWKVQVILLPLQRIVVQDVRL